MEPYCISSSFRISKHGMCFENQNESHSDDHFFTLESASCNSLCDDEPNNDEQVSTPETASCVAFRDESPFTAFSLVNNTYQLNTVSKQNIDMVSPQPDLKRLLLACAEAVSNDDFETASNLINISENMVSVTGEPIERLGAYMLEGLRARLLSSGSIIYKKLKCKEPTGPVLMSYMHVLSQVCPYYKFAYTSANLAILETIKNEKNIHIIDFQIAQGSQWVSLIDSLARRPGGPPCVRITGVDDSDSIHAREGGLDLVGRRLSDFAVSRGVPFKFQGAAINGCEVKLESLMVENKEEAIAVNFPYVLHHMPDESVSTENHRDRLLRLVKSLSPKIVTLVEQEANTNTAPFFPRFRETLDYYLAMFESIDAARFGREDGLRMGAEEHCVARDIVNIIACEGAERVERHEPFGKWRSRLGMAGLSPFPFSSYVCDGVGEVLEEYSRNFGIEYKDGALFLAWKNRLMSTSSAWR